HHTILFHLYFYRHEIQPPPSLRLKRSFVGNERTSWPGNFDTEPSRTRMVLSLAESVFYHPREPSSRWTDYPGYYMPDEHSAEQRSNDEQTRCSATDKHNGRNGEEATGE